MPKKTTEHLLLPLFRKFINEVKKGKHLQKNGKKIKSASIRNYGYLELLLQKFSVEKQFDIRVKITTQLTQKQFEDEKKYWKDFYLSFTGYLYDDLGHHDNYVGRMIKLLRSFFNYLINEKGMSIGFFHRKFYIPSEEVDIVVISPERLNLLVHSKELEDRLDQELKKVKDVFVFGCAVALRYSDLMALKKENVETINNRVYIKVQSKKTQAYTRVKLPEYAIGILKKYSKLYTNRILPEFNKVYMNKKIKVIMETYGFDEPISRTRQKRGIPEPMYKDAKTKRTYRFCDAVTTHTMRRSAITTMLSLGMNEQMVRQISGHASGSKEFYRYVAFAQTYIDTEIDMVHEKLNSKRFELEAKI
ncbi:MAG: phage integrase family protein [Bacteroidetes bacterium]|jgi:integrase|nr:phage integrase family protein [Bacteroidota bacterium]